MFSSSFCGITAPAGLLSHSVVKSTRALILLVLSWYTRLIMDDMNKTTDPTESGLTYRRAKQIIAIIAIAAFILAGFALSDRIIDFISDPQAFKEWIAATGIRGVLVFAGLNMVQVILAVVPGGPFVITAGYVFGPVNGLLLCVTACSIASIFVMLMVRRFGMKLVAIFVSPEHLKLLKDYDKSPERAKKIERLLMLIFIIPGTPKDPLNYLAGLTKIPVPVWALVNFLGRLPGASISAFTGSALGSGKWLVIVAAVGGFAVLAIVGKVLHGVIENTTDETDDAS